MNSQQAASRLNEKSTLHAIQVELQSGYNLSPVEAQVLAVRVQQLVDEQTGAARQPGQITYQAIAVGEPAGKPLRQCRKVPVHLTLLGEEDAGLSVKEGPVVLRRHRIRRLVFQALLQGGALSQEDLACILAISLKTVKRVFSFYRDHNLRLPSRGEVQDIGPGVSHKVPVIRKYVHELSFTHISRNLGGHGIDSMVRYLRHFALVMILEDRGLSPAQMQSIVGISENLINQYRELYLELNTPQHEFSLTRIKRSFIRPPGAQEASFEPNSEETSADGSKKGGLA